MPTNPVKNFGSGLVASFTPTLKYLFLNLLEEVTYRVNNHFPLFRDEGNPPSPRVWVNVEKMQENGKGASDVELHTQNNEGLHESPTVRVKLSGRHLKLMENAHLEVVEGEWMSNSLKM